MSRFSLLPIGLVLCAAASLTLAGCASSRLASKDKPGEAIPGMTARSGPTVQDYAAMGAPPAVVAGSSAGNGIWSRMTSWMPRPAGILPEDQKIKDPGKLHLAYARVLEAGGDLTKARKSYEIALDSDPKSTDALLGLARLDQLNGRTEVAEVRFLKALKDKPDDPVVLDAVGQFYASQQRWDKSIELLTEATRIEPDQKSHRFHLAVALTRAGRIDDALPHFARTVGEAGAYYNVGYILYQQQHLAAAEQYLQRAVETRPDLVQAQQILDEMHKDQPARAAIAANPPALTVPTSATNRDNRGPVRTAAADNRRVGQATVSQSRNVIPAAGRNPQDDRRPAQAANPPAHAEMPPPARSAHPGTLPPWHTSPEFHRDDTFKPQTGNPQSEASPAQSTGNPGAARPTPEQLEQWQNQFAPGRATP